MYYLAILVFLSYETLPQQSKLLEVQKETMSNYILFALF